jgi:hypothetical protein
MPVFRSAYDSREYNKEEEDFFEPPGESANAGDDKSLPQVPTKTTRLQMDDTETESSSDEVRPVPSRRRLRRAEDSVMQGSSEESDEITVLTDNNESTNKDITVLTDIDESTNIKRKSSEGESGGEGSSSFFSVQSAAKKPVLFEDPPTDDDDAVAAILDTGHQVVKAVGMMNGIRVVTSGLATNASAEQAPVDGGVKVVMSAMSVL